ncbi:hypothetical protein U1Q18_001583 [Sarracenia purpurea var. burkii]
MATAKKVLRDIEIPPRKLLGRHLKTAADTFPEVFAADSPRASDETLLQKFLPCNGRDEEDEDADPYSSDHFRIYEFKVRRCTRSRSHDWTDCPFAHPGEKARRRDPRRFRYSGTVCSDFRRGSCSRGDNCEFAHGVFECWLHPARYRTEACKDGRNCKRKVCFFAHSPREIRVLPPSNQCHDNSPPPPGTTAVREGKYRNYPAAAREGKYRNTNHCCVVCHSIAESSPTSTLMSHFSPPMSPSGLSSPPSPVKSRSISGLSPMMRYKDLLGRSDLCGFGQFNPGGALTHELMRSLESMNVNEASSPSWVDGSFNHGNDQQQFVVSPSTRNNPSGSRKFLNTQELNCSNKSFVDHDKPNYADLAGPDLDWINELLT